jgi:hypothetical protein
MIGRIKSLITSNRSGSIQADDGQTVYFNWSSVWEHDLSFLAVGHPVSFELQSGHWPKATNVHLFKGWHAPSVPEKHQGPVRLRYVGFDQANNIRTFHFRTVIAGEETRDYAVTADVEIFGKYRVGIQEGPTLCLRVVLAELAAPHANHAPFELTEKDILAHVASRTVPPRKPFRRRPSRGVSPSEG